MANPRVTKIDVSKVVHVYSGRPGCMCGCRGKHSYKPGTEAETAKRIGYMPDPKAFSDRSISRVVTNMMMTGQVFLDDQGIAYAETPTRTYAVYFG